MEQNFITLSGKVEQVIFYNETTNYMVAVFETPDGIIKISGIMPSDFTNSYLELMGKYVEHAKYGKQFKFESFIPSTPSDEMYMFEYLCEVIKGIGESTAEKILDEFGKDAFKIIEDSPEKLLKIEGIGKKKLAMIVSSYEENQKSKTTILELKKLGFSLTIAIKIYNKYENFSLKLILENPYKLCNDIKGISFKMADEIAHNLKISKSNDLRIKAGILYIMKDIASLGHCYLPKNVLMSKAVELLNIEEDIISEKIYDLAFENKLFVENLEGGECVYLLSYFRAETEVTKAIVSLATKSSDLDEASAKSIVYNSNPDYSTEILTPEQLNAITTAMIEHILVITGGPGTGKTTIINILLNALKSMNKTVALCAPTGRAAKRLSETTNCEAKTIHRLLEYAQGDDDLNLTFGKNSEEQLEQDVIIVDEASMIDIMLMKSLTSAIPFSSCLILIGDVDQLPSVGAGNVLRDIIESNVILTVRLTKIFRQSEGSIIVEKAHEINKGKMIELKNNNSEFFFIRESNPLKIKSTIVDLYTNRLPEHYGIDPKKDIQILSPTKKTDIGTTEINNAIQKIMNPKELCIKEKITQTYCLRAGDKIMQIKNNYSIKWRDCNSSSDSPEGEGLYNGDMGIIDSINPDGTIDVLFNDDKLARYTSDNISQLILAYACTVHKSQGNEFDCVIIPISNSINHFLLSRNLLYTAITRAKKLVVIVGDAQAVNRMIDNNRVSSRYSKLKYRLANSFEIE